MLWNYLSVASWFGPAYLAVSEPTTNNVGRGVLYQSLYCIALFLFAVLANGWLKGFFSYVPDMSIWLMAFSLSSFAFNTAQYYTFVSMDFFFVLTNIAIVIAAVVCTVCILHTSTWLIDLSLFKPRPKWGPGIVVKLTHEAFRFSLPRMIALVESLDGMNVAAVDHMVDELNDLFCTYAEHAKAEDELLHPMVRRYFPELCLDLDNEHNDQKSIWETMRAAILVYSNNSQRDVFAAEVLLALLRQLLPTWADRLLSHMRKEEATILAAARKYLPIERQKEFVCRMLDITPATSWYKIIPFVIRHLPVPLWKNMYTSAFVWANPARAQEIGMIIYRGTDSVTWSYLAKHIPEIIPRGVPGHRRML